MDSVDAVEIGVLGEADRERWEVLARGKDAFFSVERDDAAYARTWGRLLGGGATRGVGAWVDGVLVGIAHYVVHDSVWYDGRCYLADLYVVDEMRRRGIGRAIVEWVAADGAAHGFPGMYWNTLADADARGLYDQVGEHVPGMIVYTYRR